MKQYNFLQAFYMSFYSRSLYRDVKNNWGLDVVLYLLTLLFVFCLVTTIPFQKGVNQLYAAVSLKIFPQLPAEVSANNGELHTTENRPYVILDPQTKEIIGVIDTSGHYVALDSTTGDFLVTKTEIIYKDPQDRIQIQKISALKNFAFKTANLDKGLHKSVSWAWLLFLPVILMFSFIYRLVEALIYAIFGKIFAALLRVTISYAHVLKLAIVALTPVIVLGMLFDLLFSIRLNHLWLVCFVIAMAYIIYAINANKE